MKCIIIFKRNILQLIALLTFMMASSPAQLSLTMGDIPDMQIIRCDTIVGKALWGLIDGGADIYFEYGFSNVTVQDIIWNNYRFKVEIYMMESDESAFGIFSVSRHRCKPDSIAMWSCVTPYEIQIASGRYYITVINDTGTTEIQRLSRSISQKLLSKMNDKVVDLPDLFKNKIFLPQIFNLKFISGPLGIQNGFPPWDEKFSSLEKYRIYILPIETDSGYATVSAIKFNKTEDVVQFIRNIDPSKNKLKDSWTDKSNGIQRYFRKIDPTKIVYLESDLPDHSLKQYVKAIESIK